MSIRLSSHFTYKKLFKFCLPPIIMMIFTSIYGVVDGFFVSNYVGKIPFAAVNLVMPFIMILGGVGFMIGTGGSALIAKTLGEGDEEKANRYFTMLIKLTAVFGVLLSLIGIVFIRPISYLLGATEAMIGDCVVYGRIVLLFNTAFMLQNVFQTFLAAAEKPNLGLAVTTAGRHCKHGSRCAVYRRLPVGRCGSSHRNGNRAVHRRHSAAPLLHAAQQQPASDGKSEI